MPNIYALALAMASGAAALQAQTPAPRARPPKPHPDPMWQWDRAPLLDQAWKWDGDQLDFKLAPMAFDVAPMLFDLPDLAMEWTPLASNLKQLMELDQHAPYLHELDIRLPKDWPADFHLAPMAWDHIPPGARFKMAGDRMFNYGRGLTEPDGFQQGTPEDSLYRQAREALNQGEYRRATELFRSFEQRFGKSRYVPAAMYWQAFALYRVGTDDDLGRALRVLDDQRQRYPDAAGESEVSALLTRVVGALAARGNSDAAARLRQNVAGGKATCDREDMEVRAEALSALVQADPAAASAVIDRTLARREECTAPLRRRAIYLLGREGVAGGAEKLVEVAKNDPDPEVRSDAVARLTQLPGDGTLRALEQLLAGTTDEVIQRAALQSLRRSESPEAGRIIRKAIERDDLAESVRAEAIRSLVRRSCCRTYNVAKLAGQSAAAAGKKEQDLNETDAAYLRSLYDKTSSKAIKGAILETLASSGGSATDEWLMSMVKNPNEDSRVRMMALGRLRRSDVAIDEIAKLYDAVSERPLRTNLIEILGGREEPAATDKLIAIAKSGTDPVLRRYAISALSRKKDPRTTKLLLELVEK
ncbi:MAG: HEAT repeat domain-containing protein [Gemmatimonadota bacterium]